MPSGELLRCSHSVQSSSCAESQSSALHSGDLQLLSKRLHLQVLGNQKSAKGLGIPVGAFLTPCPQQELHLPRSPHQPACCSGCHAMLNKFCRTDPRTGTWWCAFCGEETQYHRSLLDAQVSRLQKLGLHWNMMGPGCCAQLLPAA